MGRTIRPHGALPLACRLVSKTDSIYTLLVLLQCFLTSYVIDRGDFFLQKN